MSRKPFKVPRVRTAHLTPEQQAAVDAWHRDLVSMKRAVRAAKRGLPPPPEPQWRIDDRQRGRGPKDSKARGPLPYKAQGPGNPVPSPAPQGEARSGGAPDGAVARGRHR